MTKATFKTLPKSGSITLKVEGHAGAAAKGEDIVCAAASILSYTLAQTLSFMHSEGKLQKKPNIKLDGGGTATITAKPKAEWYDEALHCYFIAQVGFHLLAHNYPQYVAVETFGETA